MNYTDKETFSAPTMEIIFFNEPDIIVTSGLSAGYDPNGLNDSFSSLTQQP